MICMQETHMICVQQTSKLTERMPSTCFLSLLIHFHQCHNAMRAVLFQASLIAISAVVSCRYTETPPLPEQTDYLVIVVCFYRA